MELVSVDQKIKCFHCGDECDPTSFHFDDKEFCCRGCLSVYEIIRDSDLTAYYELESFPGSRLAKNDFKFGFLDNPEIEKKLLDFSSENLGKIRLLVPEIHCSSCIWLLENLSRLNGGVLHSRVNLGEREVAIDFNPKALSLRGLVELLTSIGYEPSINLEDRKKKSTKKEDRGLILRIAVAGFCFGNIMLLSFPEYLGLDFGVDQQLATWFSWIMLILSAPVVLFCADGYFKSAYFGLKQKYLTIDVPIVLGIIAIAGQSYYEILFEIGPGYLDSLSGLLFLLLIGKWFQNRTYSNLSFDRDYKSYFPLAVTQIRDKQEFSVLVEQLQMDDVVLIRNNELIPTDCILLDSMAKIDYSFVTGESQYVTSYQGDLIFAGGRHLGVKTHYRVIKPVSQSYLTQLWNHTTFKKEKLQSRELLVNIISKYFTLTILVIAVISALFWLMTDPSKSLFVFTSVLIVACPCALAMATPFTLGNVMRVFGKNKLYLKNAQVVDRISTIDAILFDKTGTLTKTSNSLICNIRLNETYAELLFALASQSNHPVSREVQTFLRDEYSSGKVTLEVSDFQEVSGMGLSAKVNGLEIKFGNSSFLGLNHPIGQEQHFFSVNGRLIASFHTTGNYRNGLPRLFDKLGRYFKLGLLSGDGDTDKVRLAGLFPSQQSLHFRQKPIDKLTFVEEVQAGGDSVLMLGDGLNDAGALQKSDVGFAVTEHSGQFTPASDGILHASAFNKLFEFMQLAKWSKAIIVTAFGLSFLYNILGLSFAVSGNLTPLTAAILMPLSSISVVIFTTVCVNLVSMKLKLS